MLHQSLSFLAAAWEKFCGSLSFLLFSKCYISFFLFKQLLRNSASHFCMLYCRVGGCLSSFICMFIVYNAQYNEWHVSFIMYYNFNAGWQWRPCDLHVWGPAHPHWSGQLRQQKRMRSWDGLCALQDLQCQGLDWFEHPGCRLLWRQSTRWRILDSRKDLM